MWSCLFASTNRDDTGWIILLDLVKMSEIPREICHTTTTRVFEIFSDSIDLERPIIRNLNRRSCMIDGGLGGIAGATIRIAFR